jgi:hypothetical protein
MAAPCWVWDLNDPREQLRQILAKAFEEETGSTWLWDKGELIVNTIIANKELVNKVLFFRKQEIL